LTKVQVFHNDGGGVRGFQFGGAGESLTALAFPVVTQNTTCLHFSLKDKFVSA
jgi:hypothetical protein